MGKKIEAETDSIRVRKSVEASGTGTVIIGFRISSKRDEAAAIELRDPLPAEHEIQFQSENDEWTIREESATYECVLGPDKTATTGYKSTTTEDQALDRYTTAPSIDVRAQPVDVEADEPATEETGAFTRGASDAVFTFHGPERASHEQPTPAETTDEATPPSKPHDSDPTGPEETEESSPTEADRRATPEEALGFAEEFDAPGDEMGVADLVTDLAASTSSISDQSQETETEPSVAEGTARRSDTPRSTEGAPETVAGDVDIASPAEVQARIRRVDEPFLNGQPEQSSLSLEARVQYLQSRFYDLAAYIDAMEEFIDEHGDGEHVLTALSTDMERLQKHLERLNDKQSALQANVEATDDRVDTLDKRKETIDDKIHALAESLNRMEDGQRTVKEDVEALKAFQENLQNAI